MPCPLPIRALSDQLLPFRIFPALARPARFAYNSRLPTAIQKEEMSIVFLGYLSDRQLFASRNANMTLDTNANNWYTVQKRGFMALICILVVGAVGIAIALALLGLGLGSARTSFAVEQSNQAKA